MPRVKLDDLPSEVKTRIVELCAEQDERFQEWTAAVKAMGAMKAELAEIRRSHGRSLGALFCTSKGWSEMAAPFLFTTLVASKSTSMAFCCSVAFRRFQHFTKLVLDAVPTSTLDSLVPVLRNLTNVRELSIHHSFFDYGFKDATTRDYFSFWTAGRTRREAGVDALGVLVCQASTIALRLATSSQVNAVIVRTEALTSLRLALDSFANSASKLLELLQLVPSLQKLHLSGSHDTTVVVPDPTPAGLPKLVSLTLEAPNIHPDFLSVARLFADDLMYLRVDAPYDSEGTTQPATLAGTVFTRLKRVELEDHDDCILPAFEALAPTAFPSLMQIRICSKDLEVVDEFDGYSLEVIGAFDMQEDHPLRLVEMIDPTRPTCTDLCTIVDEWNSAHRVKLAVESGWLPDSAFLREIHLSEDEDELIARREAVERTVDYLVAETHRARAVQGEEAAAGEYRRLARVLQAAELDRVAMAD
ncbi:hypothetical protein JCM10450v2_008242 [Rhodotorula kratochvilovae]